MIDFDFDFDDELSELVCPTSKMPLSVCNCKKCRSDNEESIEYMNSPVWMGSKDAFEMMMNDL